MEFMIGEKLKKLREEKGKTLKEVAEATGLSDSYINLMENNKREPTISALKKLAPFYGVSIGFFFTDVDNSTSYSGLEILHAREARNLSPLELANMMGTDVLRIGMLETGSAKPTKEEKEKLKKILNISVKNSDDKITQNIQVIREACYKLGLSAQIVNYIIDFIRSVLKK